jgi:hypothetical protein
MTARSIAAQAGGRPGRPPVPAVRARALAADGRVWLAAAAAPVEQDAQADQLV